MIKVFVHLVKMVKQNKQTFVFFIHFVQHKYIHNNKKKRLRSLSLIHSIISSIILMT